jgi:NAD(P)H-hydrate epimerase
MILGYSAQQIRDAEAPHLAAGEPLMDRAAAGLAHEIGALLEARLRTRSDTRFVTPRNEQHSNRSAQVRTGGRVLLLVGSGNNGGDALFAGAELAASGADVIVFPVSSRVHDAGLRAALDAGAQLERLDNTSNETTDAATRATHLAQHCDVIVDAILGTGTSANPALRGVARDVVAALMPLGVQAQRPAVVAVDIPSGIDPTTGAVPDPTVLRADVTVTFGGYKAGLLRAPGAAFAGEVRLIDIGLGPDLARLEPVVRL